MLRLKIVSPERTVYDGEIVSVVVPGTNGRFEILDHHAPIISSLEKGCVSYTTSTGTEQLDVLGGFVLVKQNVVSLCVEV